MVKFGFGFFFSFFNILLHGSLSVLMFSFFLNDFFLFSFFMISFFT